MSLFEIFSQYNRISSQRSRRYFVPANRFYVLSVTWPDHVSLDGEDTSATPIWRVLHVPMESNNEIRLCGFTTSEGPFTIKLSSFVQGRLIVSVQLGSCTDEVLQLLRINGIRCYEMQDEAR